MSEIRRRGNYEQWVKFFLRALSESAESAAVTIGELSKLRAKVIERINELGRSAKRSLALLKYLEEHPVLERMQAVKELGLSFNTVSSAVKDMVSLGILESVDNRHHRKVYYYREYLEILRAGT